MNRFLRLALALPLFLTALCSSSPRAEELWSIGVEDGDNAEFAVSKDPYSYLKAFPDDVRFTAGESDPSSDWAGLQPGEGDQWGGSRMNQFEILFDLPDKPTGAYQLRIRLLGYHPNPPLGMSVDVNGDPYVIRFPSGGNQDAWRDHSMANPFHFDLAVSPDDLKQGKNTIGIHSLNCWLIWDALSFHHSESANDSPEIEDLQFTLTPLFIKKGGSLVQQARLSYLLPLKVKRMQARIQLGDETFTIPIEQDELGYVNSTLSVPEVKQVGTARLELTGQGKTLAEKSIEVKPSRKWTITVVPQAHVDIGYTELQPQAMDVHRKSNDKAVELLQKYPEFSWSVESSYVMEDWLKTRPQDKINHFFQLAQQNRLEVEAFYGNLLTGLLSDEEAFRSLYFSKKLSRDHEIPFESATLTDAPSHIWTIPTVLRKSGVKYLSMGINGTRAPLLKGGLYERSPIWWEGPDGSKVLAFFHDHYAGAGAIGLTDAWSGNASKEADLSVAEQKIPELLAFYDRPDYPYDAIHIHGAYGDNRPLTEQLPMTVRAWNKKYVYPKIIFTTNTEWFSSFEKKYGKTLDTISGDGGAYWEDGAGSTAKETALNRSNQREALLAEMLLTGRRARGELAEDYRGSFADVWHKILLYDEHTWGAHNSISQPENPEVLEEYKIKAQFADDAHLYLRSLLEVARRGLPLDDEPDRSFVMTEGGVIQSPHFKVTIDPKSGGIASIIDRDSGRELLDVGADNPLGQLIYARNSEPPYDLSVATLKNIEKIDDAVRITYMHDMFPEIALSIRFDNDRKLIELQYDLVKKMTYDKEGVYIAFPFAGERPQIDYAIANGVVRAGRDWLPGACKDWFTLQNWLRVRNQGVDSLFITYDAPLISLQDINANSWLKDLPIENGHVFAYIMNNYWFTNYKAGQSGSFRFRFAISSGDSVSFAEASRLGRGWTKAEQDAIDDMLTVQPDNVLIGAFKQAEADDAYIVRLREMDGKATQANLRLDPSIPVSKAELCNGVEDPLEELKIQNNSISVPLKPWDVVTLKFRK